MTDAGREARIFYTDGDCGAADFPGGTWEKLPEDATPDRIADRIRAWGPTASSRCPSRTKRDCGTPW